MKIESAINEPVHFEKMVTFPLTLTLSLRERAAAQ
jgi:hypothetical protein